MIARTAIAQLDLLGPGTVAAREASIEERFWAFHRAHPEVFQRLRSSAMARLRAGRTRWSIDAAFHRLRWNEDQLTNGAPRFDLNDQFTAHYARLLMQREPALRGFFELRRLRAPHDGRTEEGAGAVPRAHTPTESTPRSPLPATQPEGACV